MDDILRIEDLRVYYHERERTVKAVDGVDLALRRGQTLAIVGESGCGKTTVALATLGLVPKPGVVESGRVIYEGCDLYALPATELGRVRHRTSWPCTAVHTCMARISASARRAASASAR